MIDAFYVPDGDRYVATEWTRGPWSLDHQHGGPPAALLVRAAVARLAELADAELVRVTIDLLRPIPVGPVSVRAQVVRAGRKVQELEAHLVAADAPVVALRAIAIRRRAVPVPAPSAPALPPPPPPGAGAPHEFPFFPDVPAYHRALELRAVGGAYGSGAMAVWTRPRIPLVAGEAAITPLEHVALVADSGHGVSLALPFERYTFVNPDVTIALARPPRGAWICMDARTLPGPAGAGLAATILWDEAGELGRVLQTLVIEAREP
jgi:hypothetical protein